MRKYFNITLFLLTTSMSYSQIHEFGAVIGGSNLIGDVGSTKFVNPSDFGMGIQYRWNQSTRHSWRLNYTYMPITAKDIDSDMPLRQERKLEAKNTLHEFAFGLEFNFFEFDLHNKWFAITPYLYTGVVGFLYDDSHFDAQKTQIFQNKNTFGMALPITMGVKTMISKQLLLSAEIGARYAFTDNLDGNNPKNTSLAVQPFGNTNNNDWYMFSAISFSYTFGKNPCYCLPSF